MARKALQIGVKNEKETAQGKAITKSQVQGPKVETICHI